jgi:DNA-binding NtrC family response regulator
MLDVFVAIFIIASRLPTCEFRRCGSDWTTPRLSPGVLAVLGAYHWPGNVRELRNVVESMVALAAVDMLTEEDLPPQITAPVSQDPVSPSPTPAVPARDFILIPGDLKAAQRGAILAQVEACGGNLTRAARQLGMARSTLYLRLTEYGYQRPSA